MTRKKFTLAILSALFIVLSASTNVYANSETDIIPKPSNVTKQEGNFTLDKKTRIIISAESQMANAKVIQTEVSKKFGIVLPIALNPKTSDNAIILEVTSTQPTNINGVLTTDLESYKLTIAEKQITCIAKTETGVFYAAQSLMQAMTVGEKGKITVQCMVVEDKPMYQWRGYMLDESRHFFGMEAVKQYLDIMASLKLNRFHWHLTDEPAWRIEIKKYPKLTEIGAIGTWGDAQAPRAFYTQEQIKEIVAYAAERHIMVIPEIDMPGHAIAAGRSYPEFSAGGTGRWQHFTFHPAKEETYKFIDDVMTEVAALFPSPYIHIGADEVHYGNQVWFTDPVIQKFIKDNYLINEVGMEHYFVRRVCEIVNGKGKKMMGWDEIINTGVTPQKAVVMWWRHDKPELLNQSLEKGFDVIMTPRIPAYMDFVQDPAHKMGRRWGDGAFNELKTVYSFPENLENRIGKRTKQVLGLQGSMWTERIADKTRLDYMTFPRLLAIAEDGWTVKNDKNYADFENRVKVFMKYLDKLGIKYFNIFDKNSMPEPTGPTKADVIAEG